MAGIIYNTGSSGSVNPNPFYLPVNIGGSLLDSSIYQNNDKDNMTRLYTVDQSGNAYGLSIQTISQQIALGDFDGLASGTAIFIDDAVGLMNLNANLGFSLLALDPGSWITLSTANFVVTTGLVRFNGSLTSGTAGAASGLFFQININGTSYKIQLLNP